MLLFIRTAAIGALLAALAGIAAVPHADAARVGVGDLVVVATTEGDLLTLRDGPGTAFTALTAFAAGTTLHVLDGPVADPSGSPWYRVTTAGLVGWATGEWLAPAADSGLRYVSGSGDGIRLRDAPTLAGNVLTIVADGAPVALLGQEVFSDGIAWTLADYAGTPGWLASDFLNGSGNGGGAAPAPAPATGSAGAGLTVGGAARVVDTDGFDLRIRDGIGLNAPIFTVVPVETVVVVVNGPLPDESGALWYGINYDGAFGWVSGQYLTATTAAPTPRTIALGSYSIGPVASNPARGAAVVAEALKHVGAPYVWGGTSPTGWDCSGMVQWIYATAWRVALPRVSQDQFNYGNPIPPDQIEAGDIVFFADIAGPGITHNGIALGDGRFIHARDESRGTVISWLDEPVWASHYAGARRP
jgi:cell wall-associated NlpC family hydrolase